MPAKNDYAVQQLHRSVWFAGKPAPTAMALFLLESATRRSPGAFFFRIRFTPYEGSHLENHP
ncbi:hypothetical protein [Pseudomonas sp. VI4.1]|uniref:hypothetical protein n=1 Tax=Pseudomonas sp. VI4.1 TaxID=1941346 RepID=UPI001008491C|nr:hypothetical protein [Pseudomonas sp. VI4.1]